MREDSFPQNSSSQALRKLRALVWGSNGLRSGWRVLVFYGLFALFSAGLLFLRRAMTPGAFKGNPFTPEVVSIQELLFLSSLLLTTLVICRIEKRPFVVDGLPLSMAFGHNFWRGVLWGLASISILLLVMRSLHVFYFGSICLTGWKILRGGLAWGIAFLLVGIVEESVSRGYAQIALGRGIGFWPAAIVNSVLFGAIHLDNNGETFLGITSVVVVALFFCFTLWRTGNLWFAVGFHFMWDYAETFVYGVADSAQVTAQRLFSPHLAGPAWLSGGTVGPEGSALCIVAYCIAGSLFHFAFPAISHSKDSKLPQSSHGKG